MADFSEIPADIAGKLVAEHLDDLEDVENFGLVCSSWRSQVKDVDHTNFRPSNNTQLPWLMLADSPNSPYRRFYSLTKRMFLKIDLPRYDHDPLDNRRYFSSKGWLISVSMKRALFTFYDPFSGSIINPPNISQIDFVDGNHWLDCYYLYRFHKFIFSSRPSSSSLRHDFQVAVIFDSFKNIAFWRPGQQGWIRPAQVFSYQIDDVCFFRGQFYSINSYLQVATFVGEQPQLVADLHYLGAKFGGDYQKYYIEVFGRSSLLVVGREVYVSKMPQEYYTTSFKLYELNVDKGELTQVKEIGNRSLFIGLNSTFFVDASGSKRGCRPNSIYFNDTDFYHTNDHLGGQGLDLGIYSLDENKVVDSVYKGPSQFCNVTPPLWVELPHRSLEQ